MGSVGALLEVEDIVLMDFVVYGELDTIEGVGDYDLTSKISILGALIGDIGREGAICTGGIQIGPIDRGTEIGPIGMCIKIDTIGIGTYIGPVGNV